MEHGGADDVVGEVLGQGVLRSDNLILGGWYCCIT